MGTKIKRWPTFTASILINICLGSFYVWSVFASGYILKFGWDIDSLTNVFLIGGIVGPLSTIIGGWLLDKKGALLVALIGSIVYSLGNYICGFTLSLYGVYMGYFCLAAGMSFAYSVTLNNTLKMFPDNKGLVSGVMTSSIGASTIILAPVAQKLIHIMDVSAAYKWFGIAFTIIMVGGSLFVKTAQMQTNLETQPIEYIEGDSVIDKTPTQMVRTPLFWTLIALFFINGFCGMTMTSQLAIIAQDMICVSTVTAAIAVSWFSLANAIGRLTWGLISDKIGRYNSVLIVFTFLLVGTIFLSFSGPGKWNLFVVGVICVATCYGGCMGIFPAITAENFGLKNQGANYGIMMVGLSGSSLLGPKIAVKLKVFGDIPYSFSFRFMVIMAAIAVIVAATICIFKRKSKKSN